MTSAKEMLVQAIARLSEEDAREVLAVVKKRKSAAIAQQNPKLTREDLIKRVADYCGIRAPDPKAPPFEKFEPMDCPGIPASELLVRDRR